MTFDIHDSRYNKSHLLPLEAIRNETIKLSASNLEVYEVLKLGKLTITRIS